MATPNLSLTSSALSKMPKFDGDIEDEASTDFPAKRYSAKMDKKLAGPKIDFGKYQKVNC